LKAILNVWFKVINKPKNLL